MTQKYRATVVVSIESDFEDDGTSIPADQIHDQIMLSLPEGYTCEEILEWEFRA